MNTYVKLKDGTVWVLWSDNTDEETMHVFDIKELPDYDLEFLPSMKVVNYSDIDRTDTNVNSL